MAFKGVCKNCGSENDYRTEKKGHNETAYCNQCNTFIGNVPYSTKTQIIYYNNRNVPESFPETKLRQSYDNFKINHPEFILIPEYKVTIGNENKYIDFCNPETKIAIEIDSLQYHERTKEQIENTIKRQNKLVMNGFRVLKFTGFQANKYSDEIINEVYKFYLKLLKDQNG